MDALKPVRPNIFDYATSELSQDAFLCWLLAHAENNGGHSRPELVRCARVFLSECMKGVGKTLHPDDCVTSIERQYGNRKSGLIDVLVSVGDTKIIIEDKTYSSEHDDQLSRYEKILLDEGVPKDNVILVYYKIAEQPYSTEADKEFCRTDLIELFKECYEETESEVFRSYYEHLLDIQKEATRWKTGDLPLGKWSRVAYGNFFEHLIKNEIVDCRPQGRKTGGKANGGWGYISNSAGGFMGMWWGNPDSSIIRAVDLPDNLNLDIYLQIENDVIVVKASRTDASDKEAIRAACERISRYFQATHFDNPEVAFEKNRWNIRNHWSICHVKFNFDNYETVLKTVQVRYRSLFG